MFKALLKTMRPKQWAKSVFLFAAIVFDRQLANPIAIWHTALGALVFSLVVSVVYILNDLADVEADRKHPTKRNRPIAAGKLPIPVAIGAAVFILAGSFPVAYWLSPSFAAITAIYFLLNLLYSKWLKHIVLLDIIVLASFYVLRVAAGVTLIEVERFSPWIYSFTTFLALLIGAGKRRAELSQLAGGVNAQRRVLEGYTLHYLDQLITIASALTIITYSLYTYLAVNLPENHSMMFTIPFIIYSVMRYQYLLQVKDTGAAPEDAVLGDRPLLTAILLWGIAILAVFYIT